MATQLANRTYSGGGKSWLVRLRDTEHYS